MITCVVIQAVVIICLMVLYFRNALYSDAAVQNAKIEIQELRDSVAKMEKKYSSCCSDYVQRGREIDKLKSEIQNLHSVYQRKLDDADEQLRIESRSLASELEEAQDRRDVAHAELRQLQTSLFEKEREIQKLQDDVALLNRRLKDYDERIRASEAARLIAESQMNSIREVCCGK